MKNIKEKRGITLIALAVTIVVILILAGVTIDAVFSENGIINKAKEAANAMNNAISVIPLFSFMLFITSISPFKLI